LQIKYKGYIANVNYSAAVGLFYGEVINFLGLSEQGIISFQSEQFEDMQTLLIDAVNNYLEYLSRETIPELITDRATLAMLC